ncbi:MAG: hypothetical protein ACTSYX_04860 [Candidatus Thorarchaeota archaeon]
MNANNAQTVGPAKQDVTLPNEGGSIEISLPANSFGARWLTVKNWKGVRYYINYHYRTEFNKKCKDLGWIACDGSDWDLSLSYVPDEVVEAVRSLYPLIGGAINQD